MTEPWSGDAQYTYKGSVAVRLSDGREIEADGDLRLGCDSDPSARVFLWYWGGDIAFGELSDARQAFKQDEIEIIMPDGTARSAVPVAVNPPEPAVEISGAGPAPWDTGIDGAEDS
ncbi:hypothetical protein FHX37_0480 [Haloactinospora alba]|uniref:Uncharacterized protein n=1 Tax=Haloactinospora alba TaxID=405555 RepID=A0A543NFI1_9ACTN|nr:hypothetical protein [Haloactinospora alba]TQN30598.1 hypothetical protein FHX37_0480 [Haloactinospora alba]